jgi:membrane protein YqaA with SNARE-associated domain
MRRTSGESEHKTELDEYVDCAVEFIQKETRGATEMLQITSNRPTPTSLDKTVVTSPNFDLNVELEVPRKWYAAMDFGDVAKMSAMVAASALLVVLLFEAHDALIDIGNWGYLGVALAELGNSAVLLIPTPAPAYTFSMGAVLNPLVIGVVGGFAAAVGELVGYALGARGRNVVQEGKLIDRFRALSLRWGSAAILTFAVLPLPFDIAGMWAGAVGYPLLKFFATVAVGKIVKVTSVAMAGHYGFHLLMGG